MNYVIRGREGITLTGLTLRTNNAVERQGGKIMAAWKRFMEGRVLDTIPNRVHPTEMCAAYFDYEGDHTSDYSYLLGAPVRDASQVPEGMTCKTFPAARYAVFSASDPGSVPGTWQEIWQADIQRAYFADFELYRDLQQGRPIEIFVGIR